MALNESLDDMVRFLQDLIDTTTEDDPQRANYLEGLGMTLHSKHQQTAIMADLDNAFQMLQGALIITPRNHPDRARRLMGLGVLYGERFQRTDQTSDLDRAISLFQESVNATPQDHPFRSERLENLGIALYDKHQQVGGIANLERAVEIFYEAAESPLSEDSALATQQQASRQENLGVGLHAMYKVTGKITLLDQATEALQKAVSAATLGCFDQSRRLESLGNGLRDRYQRLGLRPDIDRAIHVYREAIDITPADHPDLGSRLHSLGNALKDRHQKTGESDDLDESIRLLQEALRAMPQSQSVLAIRLQAYGGALTERYLKVGEIADIDQAIQHYQEAIDLTPRDSPNHAAQLDSLGISLQNRYLRLAVVTDLERAIRVLQEAVDMSSSDNMYRAHRSHNLGVLFQMRHQRMARAEDLDKAINHFHDAVDRIEPGHSDQARHIESLGIGIRARYMESNNEEDLGKALTFLWKAVQLTPPDHPELSWRQENLGNALRQRFRRTPERSNDINTAVQILQQSIDNTPPHHPDRARRLDALANGLYDRHRHTNATSDLQGALQAYSVALNHRTSPVQYRLRAGRSAVDLFAAARGWQDAYEAASIALQLVPLLAPKSLGTQDKQHVLMQVAGLASDAAAIALLAGRELSAAISLLESGRGLIAGGLDEMRTDISDLQQQHPRLALQFTDLRDKLDSPSPARTNNLQVDDAEVALQAAVSYRREASLNLDETIRTIRNLPGFERFLLPPSDDEIKLAAADCPIAIVNASKYRCDAFLIQKHTIRLVELPKLNIDDIKNQAKTNLSPVRLMLLEWLWDCIAQPIIEALRFRQVLSGGYWPRVRWITTNQLSRFPIHAAGYHRMPHSATVMDRVISSYSTSLKAIVHAHQSRRESLVLSQSHQVVLVAMPSTPGLPMEGRLVHAEAELNTVQKLCMSLKLQPSMPQATKQDVLSAIKTCQIFHFAGHGYADPTDPSKSRLLLKDWAQAPLTVADLLEINLRKQSPFLAYLSACSTGQNKNADLVDESIHLISGCQLAGFRHVIGTLWEVQDKLCVELAGLVYEAILDKGISDDSVSSALHHASRKLRDKAFGRDSLNGRLPRDHRNQIIGNQARSNEVAGDVPHAGEAPLKERRDVEMCDDDDDDDGSPVALDWVPYVHFGA